MPEDEGYASKFCKIPGSRLIFASYNQSTASGDLHAFRNLSLQEEDAPSKRIVIEIPPDGVSTWRFIPRANWEDGVMDEGTWPRRVNICG